MKMRMHMRSVAVMALTVASGTAVAGWAHADDTNFEIYGFLQADAIQDFKRVHPDWDATLRPSKIPTTEGLYGGDGQSIISVRQSRFGVKGNQLVAGKDLNFKFEIDMYGVGVDEGQTTIRLRHAYGEWGPVLAGQTNSVFMDIDTFPNTIDYWGPNGMVFVRTPQIRYTYKTGAHQFAVAIEKPGNDVDPGNVRFLDESIAANLQGDEELPDLTGHYRYTGEWGHFQAAGILRRLAYETAGAPDNEPADSMLGWGINLSSNINTMERDILHLSAVYGVGIASYMNDGGTDIAPESDPVPQQPIVGALPAGLSGKAVPLWGLVAYYDHYWDDRWSSSVGYSIVQVDNTSFQAADAFQVGQYASVNLLYAPDPKILMGGELLWGAREDNNDAEGDDIRFQFSLKYNFSSRDFR